MPNDTELTPDKTPQYGTIEWFKWHAKYDTRWLGQNSEVLLKLYEVLEEQVRKLKAEIAALTNERDLAQRANEQNIEIIKMLRKRLAKRNRS